jgi:dihydrodipicolinate reductase
MSSASETGNAPVTVRVGIAGAGGRMGQALIEATLDADDLALGAAIDLPRSAEIGADAGERCGRSTGVRIMSDVGAAVGVCDVLIDFTRPAGTLAHLAACADAGVAAVVGTTGFDEAGKAEIAARARVIPIVFAPNMSVGINVLADLVRRAAQLLGPAFDIEIVEMHHRLKVDAPSGTALALGEAAAEGAGVALRDHALYAREGVTGERKPGTIGLPRCAAATSSASIRCLRRRRRAARAYAPRDIAAQFCRRRAACGTLRRRPAQSRRARTVRHARRARHPLAGGAARNRAFMTDSAITAGARALFAHRRRRCSRSPTAPCCADMRSARWAMRRVKSSSTRR